MRVYHKTSDFREIIELLSYSGAMDNTGGTKPTYSVETTTLAKVEPYDGDLFVEGGQRVLNNKYIFTIRYREALEWGSDNIWDKILSYWGDNVVDIDKTYKIRYRNNNYIIHSVRLADERRFYIKIVAWLRK
jgi:hypothetical protein